MNGYHSRKYQVAMASILAATLLAAFARMTGDVAIVLVAVNVGFHAANAAVHWRKNGQVEANPANDS